MQLSLFEAPRPRSGPAASHHKRRTSARHSQAAPKRARPPGACPCRLAGEPPPRAAHRSPVLLFERLYNAFRIRLFDSIGPRYGRALRQAEHSVRLRNPEFDLDKLTGQTAPLVLDLIEALIARSPFYQRASHRRAACQLMAELYEQHYEALRSIDALTRLEDTYYRLKK